MRGSCNGDLTHADTIDDPVGVELAGAAKNVYAIVSGMASGLGFESNTRAGLVTRSLAEMTRCVVPRAGGLTRQHRRRARS